MTTSHAPIARAIADHLDEMLRSGTTASATGHNVWQHFQPFALPGYDAHAQPHADNDNAADGHHTGKGRRVLCLAVLWIGLFAGWTQVNHRLFEQYRAPALSRSDQQHQHSPEDKGLKRPAVRLAEGRRVRAEWWRRSGRPVRRDPKGRFAKADQPAND